jgi:micrococcal nuclease
MAVLAVSLLVLLGVAGLAIAVLSTWGTTRQVANTHPVWHLEQGATVAAMPATLVQVVDGDTADFRLDDERVERVRMIGIDAPEEVGESEQFSRGASDHLEKLLDANPNVFLEWDERPRDRFGQTLAYVWLVRPNNSPSAQDVRVGMLNARMLLDGWAAEFPVQPGVVYRNVRYRELLAECAAEARAKKCGYWAAAASEGGPSAGGVEPTRARESTGSP